MDMEIFTLAVVTANAIWWVRWRRRLATAKRVNANANRALEDSHAINVWNTTMISPSTVVKVRCNLFFFQHNSSFVRESSFAIRAHPVLLRSSLPTGGMMTSCQTLIENKQTNKEAERKRVFKWRRAHTSAHLLKPFEPWKRTFLKLSSTFDLSVKMLSKAHAKHCVSNVFFCVLLFSALWKVVDIWCRHEGHVFFQRD